MKILILSGVKCTNQIWEKMKPYLEQYDAEYIEYDHEITKKASNVSELTAWVYKKCSSQSYDVVIGHSLGGLIGLQLSCDYPVSIGKMICLDTNFRPAEAFYRNLMTEDNMKRYSQFVFDMFEEESKFYLNEFFETLQCEFDYVEYVVNSPAKVYVIYGDRGMPEYDKKLEDLNLDEKTLDKLQILFCKNACHMMMLENSADLNALLNEIMAS